MNGKKSFFILNANTKKNTFWWSKRDVYWLISSANSIRVIASGEFYSIFFYSSREKKQLFYDEIEVRRRLWMGVLWMWNWVTCGGIYMR